MPDRGAVRRWVPLAPPLRADRAEAPTAFRDQLLAALRSGHAVGAVWEVRIDSGAAGELAILTLNPAAGRWFARSLAPAYGFGRWHALDPPNSPERAGPTVSSGRRRVAWPAPLWAREGPGFAFDRVARTLRALAPGWRLRVGLRPRPSPGLRWWELPRPPPSPPFVAGRIEGRPAPAPFGSAERGPLRPVFWEVTFRLEGRTERRPPSTSRDLARALDVALRDEAGNGISFRRGSGRAGHAREERFVEVELLSLLPPATIGRAGGEGGTEGVLPLGRTAEGAPVGIPIEADQGRHLAIVGETGMGKSSLLVALAGRMDPRDSVLVLDPIGDTAAAMRRIFREAGRPRLAWIDPSHAPVTLNALDGAATSERRLNDLVHALRKVRAGRYSDPFWGPRLEEMLTRALHAAAELPGGTLGDAYLLLATGGRAPRAETPSAREAVRELADRIRDRPDDAEGARRLLFEVVRSPVLSRMVAAPAPSGTAADLVAPGCVTLVSGGAAEVGETTARYLLAIYLALAWSELLARSGSGKTFVVLDEAQWFAHESLAEMLRLGRRANVHVVLATQSLASLPEGVREAVWTNVADLVVFRGSPEEAREVGRIAPGAPAEAILALPRGWAVFLRGKGQRATWIRAAHRTPSGATPAAAAPPAPVCGETEILEWLDGRAPRDPGVREVEIALADLRADLRPDDALLRRLGARLGRAGAIVARPGPRGPIWVVRPVALRAAGRAPAAESRGPAAEVPQRS